MQDVPWDHLRFVLAAARAGSRAGAARALGVNESTVARRVAQAEAALGARLFERGPEGLVPTQAGAEVAARAERVELEVQGAAAAVAGTDALVAGTVRVSAVPIVANRLLAPALPALMAAHPGLVVELGAEPRNLSLTRREADIALRLARPEEEQRALARRVGSLAYAPFAAPGGREAWLGYEDALADLPPARWVEQAARESGLPVAARARDAETLLEMAAAGAGRALLPVAVAERDRRLVQAGPVALRREAWLMTHPALKGLARIRAVADWIAASLPRRSTRRSTR